MYSRNGIISILILVLGCFGFQNILAGTVYQWTDESGNVNFSDVPPDGSVVTETREISINQHDPDNIDFEKYSIINQAKQMAEWRKQLTEERLAKRKLYLEEKRLLHELELIERSEVLAAEEYIPRNYYYAPYHFPHRLGHGVNSHPHQTHQKHPVIVTSNKRITRNKCC